MRHLLIERDDTKKDSPKECIKIVQLNELHADKLREISNRFNCSNRRAMQFCLDNTFRLQSAQKMFHYKTHSDAAGVIHIPFSPEQCSAAESYAHRQGWTFKELCQRALLHTEKAINESQVIPESKIFKRHFKQT